MFADWKKLLEQLRQVREEYRTALPEKRPAIEKRYYALIADGEAMLPKVTAAAEAAYNASPDTDKTVSQFLLGILTNDLDGDDYEEAFRLAKLLIDSNCSNRLLPVIGGIAAFGTGEFDLAQKWLTQASQQKLLDKVGGQFTELAPQFVKETPFYLEAWKKEKALRDAEAKENKLPRVLLKTSKGDVELELFENDAPNAVANFISLVEKKFYNGTPFHRVLPQFMAQGGDPTGTGGGGPGYQIDCECLKPGYRTHFRGSISMAHAGPNTGGSQFFLTFRPTHHLDGKHTVFGRVIKGMDVLSKLQRRDPQTQADVTPDKIVEATVIRKQDHPYVPKTNPDRRR